MSDDLRPGGFVPLTLGFGSRTQNSFTGHVDPQFSGVEHLDADDVVLATVAGSERLGHRRDSDTEQLAALSRFLLLGLERRIPDGFQAQIQTLGVLTGVGQEPEGCSVREHVVLDEVHPSELRLVHSQVVRGGVNHPLLEEHRLRHSERTPVGDAAGGLVRVIAVAR